MLYNEDLTVLKDHPKRYVAREYEDNKGPYWRLYGIVFTKINGFHRRRHCITADTFEEFQVWCDLHGITIHHKEMLTDDKRDF